MFEQRKHPPVLQSRGGGGILQSDSLQRDDEANANIVTEREKLHVFSGVLKITHFMSVMR